MYYILLRPAYSYHHFRYYRFEKNGEDFSGKTLPSVPAHTASLLADLYFKKGLSLSLTGYHATAAFLNDANTARQSAYLLLGLRAGWDIRGHRQQRWRLYAGADNLLDETYSLGNDINAAGGRYYNAAPGRNFYAGISWNIN